MSFRKAIARALLLVIVVVVIVILAVGAYIALSSNVTTFTSSSSSSPSSSTASVSSTSTGGTGFSSTTSSSTSSSTSTSSSANSSIPSVFTYETFQTARQFDPDVSYAEFDYNVLQNVYETLLWYNRNSSSEVIPWLAQNYTMASNGLQYTFNLRKNITFADGELFNSSAVYFSLNRLLVIDANAPNSAHTQAAWILQQQLNYSLSGILCGCNTTAAGFYTPTWLNAVLGQNFIQITGPYSFKMNLQTASAAFPYLFANVWAAIVAPAYVMKNDLSLWKASGTGYSLPFTTLSGNLTNQIYEYYRDEIATCFTGSTPAGCGTTYLDNSFNGSLAGTGPYTMKSFSASTNDIVLQANPNFWGGPYQFNGSARITPSFKSVDINYVPDQTTREFDLKSGANTGQALSVDITNDNLYDVANQNDWLKNNTLVSTVPGVTLYGPYTGFHTDIEVIGTNVTNPNTKAYYTFQPFADLRMRLAFGDAINMTEINVNVNHNLGQVAINGMPPGFPPQGTFNSTDVPRYSYNLTGVQNLLLQAMEHPLTNFTLPNGATPAPGTFNNTFGCSAAALSAGGGRCASPVQQTVTLNYPTGDSVDASIIEQMAIAVNNVSSFYNMGLTVSVVPIPKGILTIDGFSGYLYMWASSADEDYPWSIDFLGPLYAPANIFTFPSNWNISIQGKLFNQALADTASGNISGLVKVSNLMNEIANQQVQYIWTIYPQFFQPITSNVKGMSYNSAIYGTIEYFATLY